MANPRADAPDDPLATYPPALRDATSERSSRIPVHMVDVVRILANVSTDDEMLRRQMLVLPPEEFQAWLQRRHNTLNSARADRVTIARPFATARQCASVGCDL